MSALTRWLFADQLGPHFLDDPDQPVLLIESRRVFARRRFHRQKAHLVLSALRHRAAEGQHVRLVHADTYREGLRAVRGPLEVVHPTSRRALELVQNLAAERDLTVLPARGFATSAADFRTWADRRGARRLLLEDFYRDTRTRLGILMDGREPVGGRWNYDADNREPPPKGRQRLDIAQPWWPVEDDIDAEVRRDLDAWQAAGDVSFVGLDGPRRFAVTATEAAQAADNFIDGRLGAFGPHEDAMLAADDWMAHSLLSAPLNLGLLDPTALAVRAERAYRDGLVPLASAEGFIRQVIGWRDYIWHLYWHLGPDYPRRNALLARQSLPDWFTDLDADAVQARCLSDVLRSVSEHGWVHHIPRLMVLGNYALQRGWRPDELTDWFHRSFVDGYEWVMAPNVVGMSQHADGGVLATKPYAAGGAYLNRMSDYCGGCRYSPSTRIGPDACPFTAGYWWFLDRNAERLQGNHRMAQPLAGLRRLADRDAVTEQEQRRGNEAP